MISLSGVGNNCLSRYWLKCSKKLGINTIRKYEVPSYIFTCKEEGFLEGGKSIEVR
jgi:hypothetical protein